ncbi:MAG TPA: YciI family protein [Bryobacteraceae bacterium]|nr:YciI family protein [Bryobacteraceae bacterium]
MELSPRVIAAIEKYFAEADRPEVARLLSEYGDSSNPDGAERIHRIILRISRKDVGRVRKLVEMAKQDYRDVIVAESHPNRTYFAGLLRPGPNAKGGFLSLKLASLEAWKKAGAIVIGGRFMDDGGVFGLYIFAVDSLEQARELVSRDPGVQSGELQFEFHPWFTADGLQVGVPKHFLDV